MEMYIEKYILKTQVTCLQRGGINFLWNRLIILFSRLFFFLNHQFTDVLIIKVFRRKERRWAEHADEEN